MIRRPLIERFMEKVSPEPNSGCWLWDGAVNASGYGLVSMHSKSRLAHRMAFGLFIAPVPDALDVLHKCDVRCCVNPDHLWLGDHDANMADMVAKGRVSSGERNGFHKLNAEQVRRIRTSGEPPAVAAARHGIHKNYVYQLRRGFGWSSP